MACQPALLPLGAHGRLQRGLCPVQAWEERAKTTAQAAALGVSSFGASILRQYHSSPSQRHLQRAMA